MTIVNERSIRSLKRRALKRTKTLARDPETQEFIQPSKFSMWLSKLKTPFTREFWENLLETTDNESLVDGKLLSYSYLEAGLIETLATYVLLLFIGIIVRSDFYLLGLLHISSYFSVTDLRPLILYVPRKVVVCNLFNFCRSYANSLAQSISLRVVQTFSAIEEELSMLRVRSLLSGRPSRSVSYLLSPTTFNLCLIYVDSLSLDLYHSMLQCMSPN